MSTERPEQVMPEAPKVVTLGGETFDFVKGRRNKTEVYRAQDQTRYLRIGPTLDIEREGGFHKQLLAQGYPVPEILEEGERNPGESYYVEASAGTEKFGSILGRECQEKGAVEEPTFSRFLEIVQKYLEAQKSNVAETSNWESAFLGSHFDLLLEEMPEEKQLIMQVWEKIQEDLKDVSFVLCHGDFNAYNILPGGVIDFETPFGGPLGYDLVSAVASVSWFPRKGDTEILAKYSFTPEQIEKLWELAPDTMKDFDALFLLRSSWAVVRMDQFPKLQAWRNKLFREAMDRYVKGDSLYEWWRTMPQE